MHDNENERLVTLWWTRRFFAEHKLRVLKEDMRFESPRWPASRALCNLRAQVALANQAVSALS